MGAATHILHFPRLPPAPCAVALPSGPSLGKKHRAHASTSASASASASASTSAFASAFAKASDTIRSMGQHRIKLYQGSVNECSYLPAREAINIYADPHHPHPRAVYDQLITKGFRRSGEYVYKPGCTHCSACVPIRVRCQEFAPRRTDRRNLKLNEDLTVRVSEARVTDAYFELYQRYLQARHPGGGMDDANPEDFERFLLNPWGETVFLDVYAGRKLLAVAVTDVTRDGLSAVYTFFDPAVPERGLGRFCILQQIELCRTQSSPYLYLGYWVDGCQKMQYKTDFRPHEQFDGRQWQPA